MAYKVALTTFDNPFDPFDQFDEWYNFDTMKGYNSCCYLARIVNDSESLTEQERTFELERAIDEIIKYNPLNIYKKVKKETKDWYKIISKEETI